ncbi:hypothetical protein HMPREF1516_0741 [Streptococcus sp. CM6]|uniref:hypothetical protein n=1 Tax=Streptococcus sp. CM6 TaxID=936580 RepID=UPI00044D98CE|nr:hypothetical protein [Streptococcus sp. CM6]EUC81387.1 hypothetical protein HMPREF1516_0741 [Streptococcus sp. CM6]
MKKTETFIVLRNKKTGNFLLKYKSKEQTLAYSAHYTEELKRAAKNEVEATKVQIENFTKLANALDCELLEVTATYELKTLDGEEPEGLIEGTETSDEEEFKRFLKMLKAGLEND